MLTRRFFCGGLIAAPAIVKAASLMPIRGLIMDSGGITFGPFDPTATLSGIYIWDGLPYPTSNMLWYGKLKTDAPIQVGGTITMQTPKHEITLI